MTIPIDRERGSASVYYIGVARFVESAWLEEILVVDNIESIVVVDQYTIEV